MKRLWIAVLLLVVVIGTSVGALMWQLRMVDHLEKQLETLETAVRSRAVNTVEKAETFRDECIAAAEKIECLSHHANSVPLKECAVQLPLLLSQKEYTHFWEEITRCRFYLEELRRAEKPLLENIF